MHKLFPFSVMLFVLQVGGLSQQTTIFSDTEARQGDTADNQLEVKVVVDPSAILDVSKDVQARLLFQIKNISPVDIGFMHVNNEYRTNVEIRLADRFNDTNTLFPLPMSGGGRVKWIKPNDTFTFSIDVPITFLKMTGKQFIAGVSYSGLNNQREFRGEAFSKPFKLP